MTELNEGTKGGFSRRTMVKGAAWSVPVIAVAAATPMASASTAEQFDVQVAGTCSGDYKAAGLTAGVIDVLATLLGLDAATREFTITAAEGTIPSGTQFVLEDGGLLNLGILTVTGALDVNALNIVRLGGGGVSITLEQDLAEGESFTIDLLSGLVDVGIASNMTLSLSGEDNPSTAPGAANSASVSTLVGTTANALGQTIVLQVCS